MPQALSRSFSSTRSYMKSRLLGLKRRWLRGFIWCPQRNWGWTSTRSTNPGMLRQEESFECGDSFRAKGRKSAWPGSQEAGTSSSCSKQVENQQVPDKSNGFQIQESLWIGRNGWGHPLGGRSCSWREDKTSLGAFLRAELSEKAWVELGECKGEKVTQAWSSILPRKSPLGATLGSLHLLLLTVSFPQPFLSSVYYQ